MSRAMAVPLAPDVCAQLIACEISAPSKHLLNANEVDVLVKQLLSRCNESTNFKIENFDDKLPEPLLRSLQKLEITVTHTREGSELGRLISALASAVAANKENRSALVRTPPSLRSRVPAPPTASKAPPTGTLPDRPIESEYQRRVAALRMMAPSEPANSTKTPAQRTEKLPRTPLRTAPAPQHPPPTQTQPTPWERGAEATGSLLTSRVSQLDTVALSELYIVREARVLKAELESALASARAREEQLYAQARKVDSDVAQLRERYQSLLAALREQGVVPAPAADLAAREANLTRAIDLRAAQLAAARADLQQRARAVEAQVDASASQLHEATTSLSSVSMRSLLPLGAADSSLEEAPAAPDEPLSEAEAKARRQQLLRRVTLFLARYEALKRAQDNIRKLAGQQAVVMNK